MPEVREQAPHAATLGIQRRKVLKWLRIDKDVSRFRWLCMHAQHLRLQLRRTGDPVSARGVTITPATLRFFRELSRHNRKEWMDANRERYRSDVVQPLRALLAALTPAALKLHPGFDTSGRTGVNFSRINRDTRFANDKTPYRTQMYLTFPDPAAADGGTAQLYVGISAETVTAGFRAYAMGSAKKSQLTQMVQPRVASHPEWLVRQKKRLGRRYESYWYSTEKGEWTKHAGWPVDSTEWKRLKGWVVRRKFPPGAAARPAFVAEISRLFRDVYSLFMFVSSPHWKS